MSNLVLSLALLRAETADDDQDVAKALGEAGHESGECESGECESGECESCERESSQGEHGNDKRWPWRGAGFFGHRRVAR